MSGLVEALRAVRGTAERLSQIDFHEPVLTSRLPVRQATPSETKLIIPALADTTAAKRIVRAVNCPKVADSSAADEHVAESPLTPKTRKRKAEAAFRSVEALVPGCGLSADQSAEVQSLRARYAGVSSALTSLRRHCNMTSSSGSK